MGKGRVLLMHFFLLFFSSAFADWRELNITSPPGIEKKENGHRSEFLLISPSDSHTHGKTCTTCGAGVQKICWFGVRGVPVWNSNCFSCVVFQRSKQKEPDGRWLGLLLLLFAWCMNQWQSACVWITYHHFWGKSLLTGIEERNPEKKRAFHWSTAEGKCWCLGTAFQFDSLPLLLTVPLFVVLSRESKFLSLVSTHQWMPSIFFF